MQSKLYYWNNRYIKKKSKMHLDLVSYVRNIWFLSPLVPSMFTFTKYFLLYRWLCAQKIYKLRQIKLSQFIYSSLGGDKNQIFHTQVGNSNTALPSISVLPHYCTTSRPNWLYGFKALSAAILALIPWWFPEVSILFKKPMNTVFILGQ